MTETTPGTAFDFTLNSLSGAPLPLRAYAGRPLLVVNTASRCGFTPQYAGLQALWAEHRGRGLTVLGVPSNDFGGQEPGTAEEIGQFCAVNYGVDFPMAAKVGVRGAAAHPLFLWLGRAGISTSTWSGWMGGWPRGSAAPRRRGPSGCGRR